ncbi:MAG: endonuclease/exonuclease/phosphatase family protein [bacterium]
MKWRNLLFTGSLLLSTATTQAAELFSEDFSSGDLGQMTAIDLGSNANWFYSVYPDGSTEPKDQFAEMNGYGADAPSHDWLVTPSIDLTAVSEDVNMKFTTIRSYTGGTFKVYISTDYAGDPQTATWNLLGDSDLDEVNFPEIGAYFQLRESGYYDISSYTGSSINIGFEYTSSGTGSGEGAVWRLLDLTMLSGALPLEASIDDVNLPSQALSGVDLNFKADVKAGTPPYSVNWDFGDGAGASGTDVTHQFSSSGNFTVTMTATDSAAQNVVENYLVKVEAAVAEPIPAAAGDLRIATFNAYLNRNSEGALKTELAGSGSDQIRAVAEIIQRVRPDVILLNEFDTVMDGSAIELFINDYLGASQNGADPIVYPYYYVNESNTGIDSGLDLNGDGKTGTADDAYGYGAFPGQYGMALLSRYPIKTEQIRTFQKFLWKDMPNALLPEKSGTPYYSPEILAIFRLSSKSHWDIPVDVNGTTVHVLASHPTPPVFDDGTLDVDGNVNDWNGTRNHDEIRFWADYVDATAGTYIYDDAGTTGPLGADQRFVVLGDENASADEGDATHQAIEQLLSSALVQSDFVPKSKGGIDNDPTNVFARTHTAGWKMRADYVLPSSYGLEIKQGAVFWPGTKDPLHRLTGLDQVISSDHRMVWLDLALKPETAVSDATDSSNDSANSTSSGSGALSIWMFALLTGLFGLRSSMKK